MRLLLILVIPICAVLGAVAASAADQEPLACAEAPAVSAPEAAFEAYCGRCHDARKMAHSYFDGVTGAAAARREAELAEFLNRHSGCPHRHHEEIAAWLRQFGE